MTDQAPIMWENRRQILKEKDTHVFEQQYVQEYRRSSSRGGALPTYVEGSLSMY